jgi:uncharacterized flavoprotein (TIGR03862 family)
VAIVGGGPGGLMAAEVLATAGAAVTLYERMRSPGRKFLLAGRGGLNLTHAEPLDAFIARYGEAAPVLARAVTAFDPEALRSWSAGLGEATFVGTSGRVFPHHLRATPLLRAWLRRLDALGVTMRSSHTWQGWSNGDLVFTTGTGDEVRVRADATVLALGGASWPRTGSDGAWVTPIAAQGVAVAPLRPANSGFAVTWSPAFRARFAGVPLKNVRLSHGSQEARGDAMVTDTGIEGGPVYALSALLRDTIEREGTATLTIDLHPDLSVDELADRLTRRRPKDSTSTALRRAARLQPVSIALLREAGPALPTEARALARLIKSTRVTLTATQPLDRAISTAGGVALDEIDEHFMLRRRPGTFVAGEMLDWEAPTGGYLLQATFSTAVAAATGAVEWLSHHPPNEAV